MPNAAAPTSRMNGGVANPPVAKIGRELRRIAEKIAASGEKPLTRRQLDREIADRRVGKF